MDQARREWIDNVADAVRRAYSIGSPVGGMQDVVSKIGGKIVPDHSIPDGRIVKDGNDSFIIYIASGDESFDSNRARFTIAHELGHLFLHMFYQSDAERWDHIKNDQSFDRGGYSDKESDANEFAGAFLMPKDEFRNVIHRLAKDEGGKKYVNTSELAKHFKVSELAAINRGKFLGIFQW